MTKKLILVANEAQQQIGETSYLWQLERKIIARRINIKTFQFSCTKEKCNRRHLSKQYC